jgi:hypothetical protein
MWTVCASGIESSDATSRLTVRKSHYESAPEVVLVILFLLHLSCAMCPFRAVVRVNSAPQRGQTDFAAVPDFSR